jgi:hypothetical protein
VSRRIKWQQHIRITPAGCWEWTDRLDSDGYGRWGMSLAYRRLYLLLVGPIGTGLQLDHLCRNRPCVNPEHMEPVTALVNSRRAALARFPELCKWGHRLEALPRRGKFRVCKQCDVRRQREYQARRKVA